MKQLYLMYALDMLCLFMFKPLFVPYIQSLGGSHFVIGLFMSSSSLISFFWNPIVGSLSDTKGRKRILTQSLVFCLLGNVLLSASSSLILIFIARLVCALGGQTSTLLRAIMSDKAQSKNEKSAAFNKLGVISSISLMIGSLFGGYMSEYNNGMRFISAVISVILIVNIVLTNILQQEVKIKTSDNGKDKFNILRSFSEEIKTAVKYLKTIEWSKYWDVYCIKGCLEMGYGVAQINCALVLINKFGISGRHIGFTYMLFSIIGISTNILLLKLKNKVYAKDQGYLRLTHGTILLILAFSGLGLSTKCYIFILFMVIIGISRPLCESTLHELLATKTSESDRGSVMSVYDNIIPVVGLIAPLVSGIISDMYGEQLMIMLCTIPASVGFVLAFAHHKIKTD